MWQAEMLFVKLELKSNPKVHVEHTLVFVVFMLVRCAYSTPRG